MRGGDEISLFLPSVSLALLEEDVVQAFLLLMVSFLYFQLW